MHQYVCQRCHQPFQSGKLNKKYCSHACYAKRFDSVTKTCEVCNKTFTVAYRFREQKTCGAQCGHVLKGRTLNTRETKQCLTCGNDFEVVQSYKDKGRYCSYDCFLVTRKTRQPDVTNVCESCGCKFTVPFTRSAQRFCDKSCANSGAHNSQFGLGKLQAWNQVPRWHVGKTKETDPRLLALGEKISTIIADKMVSGSWSPPTTGYKGEHYAGIKNGGKVAYLRSSYESTYVRMLDADPDVVAWDHEPMRIPYVFGGAIHNYVPDVLVTRHGNKQELVEIKPDCMTTDDKNLAKRRAAEAWCTANGVVYLLITENELDYAKVQGV